MLIKSLFSLNIVGHNNFLEPTLILTTGMNVGHIDFQLTLNF